MVDDWQQDMYDATFEEMYQRMLQRRRVEVGFRIEDLAGQLESEYVNQGNDWIGKSSAQQTVEAATIAAYEVVLAEWCEEEKRV